MKKVGCLSFGLGFFLGIITLGGAMLIFGDYDEPTTAAAPAPVQPVVQSEPVVQDAPAVVEAQPEPIATNTSVPAGLTFAEVCDVSRSNLTEPQMEAHVRSFEGQTFTGWQGYVYDVVSRSDGYRLSVAMQSRGESIIWTRQIDMYGVPDDLAIRLNVEQPITFSGRIAAVETTFGTACNPMRVDEYTITE